MAMVDLLAILPFYIPMIIPYDLRFLRILRLFRFFRLLKLNRYSQAMKEAIEETERRRRIQTKFNEEHNITPETIKKPIIEIVELEEAVKIENQNKKLTKKQREKIIKDVEIEMRKAAEALDFEKATELRDIFFELKMETEKKGK